MPRARDRAPPPAVYTPGKLCVNPALLVAEYARRQQLKTGVTSEEDALGRLVRDCFPEQRAFIEDSSRELCALCSRRSGKSWSIGVRLLLRGWSDPGGLSVYIARSKGGARLIMWPEVLEKMNQEYGLGLRLREIDNQLMVFLPNGHRIWLAGAKDASEIGKFRGLKYKTAVVDEAQELPFLDELIGDVLEHALLDKQGDLILAGTPGPVPTGLFYRVTTGEGGPKWPTHSWTIFENPHIPTARADYARYLARYGRTDDHPTVQREWWGRWVKDLEALFAVFTADTNGFWLGDLGKETITLRHAGEEVERVTLTKNWDFAVVVDLGAGENPTTAFVTLGQHRGSPETYILSAEKRSGMIPSSIAARAEALARALPKWPTIVVDEGGLGKGYADEMRLTYGLGNVPAEKTKKRAYLEIFSGDMATGSIKVEVVKCRALLDELSLAQWNEDRSELDDRFEDHAIMGGVYGCRALRPNYRPEEEPPKPGTREWYAAEARAERKAAQERVKKRLKHARNRWSA